MFQNSNNNEYVTGGMSVSKILYGYNAGPQSNAEMPSFTRFTNLVVPVGLQMNRITEEENEYNHHEIGGVIDSSKFDRLFYLVGKDLGKSKTRTYKNRTMKNPTK
jgi:hypothetical protein